MSQVMSQGAYILFYIRSRPRPQREFCKKAIQQQVPPSARCYSSSRTQQPSRKGHGKSSGHFLGSEPSLHLKPENGIGLINHTNGILGSTNRNVAQAMEFSDATSSGWSLSASSDEASFTTESTSDSFSTLDYTDACNADTFSSIFSNLYAPVILVGHSVL
ncbi:ubiquitin C-terminal hydrolase 15-like [Hevea brasiliensis]|nr:ubiquitin C-terminal hydrolase 15-like [Hevea brasiliensis]XP_057998637.1 ubiquitin C-terminal hydrolase 15-like [Hevea brasiliensis]